MQLKTHCKKVENLFPGELLQFQQTEKLLIKQKICIANYVAMHILLITENILLYIFRIVRNSGFRRPL